MMASFLYKQFLANYLLGTNAVNFGTDTIRAGLFRSSSYSANQNTDAFLSDAGNPVASTVVSVTVAGTGGNAGHFAREYAG